uniref:RING-type domain-containing protein n=1 Tax=Globisporangium ultimum (strain ATCC 200006 / CBS 805.95 / DAOM BR144) TaxID=431595 RepID=K3X556_GLOUD
MAASDMHSSSSAASMASTASSSSSVPKRARVVGAGVPAVPAALAWLESTALEMTASTYHCHTEYVLRVHYQPANARAPVSWKVSHSFEDYREFQHRLLKALAYGHACSAECKWLHSFVKKYFPKKALFGNCSPSVMTKRREKLIKCMNVLMASLLNRGNHGCSVLVNDLATEFMNFIQGDLRFALVRKSLEEEQEMTARCSVGSFVSTTSTDSGENDHTIEELYNKCDLCGVSLDADDAACVRADACSTTTLSCGHHFHDACVIPQLEALDYCCPMCDEPQLE